MWTIWGERNRQTSENEEQSIQDIKNGFLVSLFEYCTSIGWGILKFLSLIFLDLIVSICNSLSTLEFE